MMSKVGLFFLPSFLSFSESHSYSALYAPASYAPRDPPPCNTKALSFAGISVILLLLPLLLLLKSTYYLHSTISLTGQVFEILNFLRFHRVIDLYICV